jgi:hypothetical protein
MAALRALGALAFVFAVALLTLDAAQSLSLGHIEVRSLGRLWTDLDGDSVFRLRLYLADWLGPAAESVIGLPAVCFPFGLGLLLLFVTDTGPRREPHRPVPL